MPLISVIVPVYKVEKYLARCIDSIVKQSFKDFELILVDDGSPDKCPSICDEYAKKHENVITLHKENGGQASARNYGIEYALQKSNSRYLTFVDSDDWIHVKYLELLYNNLVKNDVAVCCCSFSRTSMLKVEDVTIDDYDIYIGKTEKLWGEKKLNIAVAWGKLYKKDLFLKIRFPDKVIYEDMRTIPRVLLPQEQIAIINCPLYYYYFREESTMNSELTTNKYNDCFDCFKEMTLYFIEYGYYDALYHWFQVYFRWQFFSNKRFTYEYLRYIYRHKIFLSGLHSFFPFDKYEEEYSKMYSKLYIRIMQKLEKIGWFRIWQRDKGLRK